METHLMLTMVTVLILPLCAIITTQAGECHKMHITVYWETLASIKFGEMARNCLDKYLANLKFGDSHNQIESYDVIMRTTYAYMYSHLYFSLDAAMPDCRRWKRARLTGVSVVIMYSEVFGAPHIDRVGTTGRSFLWKNLYNAI